jgi:uncharacterized protein (DUF4415 family)
MTQDIKIEDTAENWENGALGTDEQFVKIADPSVSQAVDEALGLQAISIRLNKDLIDTFKRLAAYHGIGYQPLMRDALRRFAEAEMKQIVIANTPPVSTKQAEIDEHELDSHCGKKAA